MGSEEWKFSCCMIFSYQEVLLYKISTYHTLHAFIKDQTAAVSSSSERLIRVENNFENYI